MLYKKSNLVFFKIYLTSFVFKSFLSGFIIRVRGEVRVRDGLGDGFRVTVNVVNT